MFRDHINMVAGIFMLEPTTGIEPVNLFLTKEVLYLLSYVGTYSRYPGTVLPTVAGVAASNIWSGKRGSNPRHSAWKADALPTELFPRSILQIAASS